MASEHVLRLIGEPRASRVLQGSRQTEISLFRPAECCSFAESSSASTEGRQVSGGAVVGATWNGVDYSWMGDRSRSATTWIGMGVVCGGAVVAGFDPTLVACR